MRGGRIARGLWPLLALLLVAAAPPAAPQGRVSDFAGLLAPAQRQALEEQLAGYEPAPSTGPQIAVAIFPDLDGVPIEDFSIRLAERWKIGSRADDGVLLVMGVKEHDVRIEVGYGLEGKIPDAVAARIIRELIVPRFRAGDFAGGLRAGVTALHQAMTGTAITGDDPLARASPIAERAQHAVGHRSSSDDPWALLGGGALFVLLILVLIFGGPGVRGFILGMFFSSIFGGRRGGGGGGGGGGGFSGGGGSFGGGGASGKW